MRALLSLLLFSTGFAHVTNQSFQDLNNMPSTQEVSVYYVPIVEASAENLQGYGKVVHNYERENVEIVTWPAQGWRKVIEGTGNEAGIVEGVFTIKRQGSLMVAENQAVKRSYITGWFGNPARVTSEQEPDQRGFVLTHEANYRPDGGQVFFPKDGKPFVALLALAGDDISPKDFKAFYFDGSFGVQVAPGVWHQPMFAADDSVTLQDKQGAVHACIGVDFVKEFNAYLAVPLSLQEQSQYSHTR